MFKPTLEYHLSKTMPVTESGCWIWMGTISSKGYGRLRVDSRQLMAHRYIYERLRGPIPEGLTIDHLCRVRCCVNPDHLEPVTNAVNVLRGIGLSAMNAVKTHCVNGHPFDESNSWFDGDQRNCRACKKAENGSNRERNRKAVLSWWHRIGKFRRAEKRARGIKC